MLARDVRVVDDDVALAAAPDRRALPCQHRPLAVERQEPAAACARQVVAGRRGGAVGRVDHRVAVVGLRRLRVALGLAEQLRLDAELAQVQALVGLELDLRTGDQCEPLAAGALEQVVGELLLEGSLVALELLTVLR